jgi:hypothetical protein
MNILKTVIGATIWLAVLLAILFAGRPFEIPTCGPGSAEHLVTSCRVIP